MQSNKVLHIIIEGADKVGKSTVVSKLSEILDLPVIKMPDMPKYFKNKRQEEASEVFNKAVVQFAHTAFIMDRGYPSSLVYAQYFLRPYDLRYITDIAAKLDARIFILDVVPRKNDDLISHEEQGLIRNLYLKLAKKYNWTVIDCTDRTPSEICEIIIHHINK